LINHVFLVK